MSELHDIALVGLPNILDSDKDCVQAVLVEGEETSIALVDAMVKANPLIEEVIDHDCDYYEDVESGRRKTGKIEVDTYVFGVELGYEFVIGSLTAVYMARSGCVGIGDYLQRRDLLTAEMPVQNRNELERIKLVREGGAVLDDRSHKGYPETSSELSIYHFNDYLFELVGFDGLYQQHAQKMCGTKYNGVENPMLDGFHSGAANALEMYVQSAEERLIIRLKEAA